MTGLLCLIVLAAICKSITDTLASKFSDSVFSKLSPEFFDPRISWLNKYHNRDLCKGINVWVFQPLADAWHIANTVMIVCWLTMPYFAYANTIGFMGYLAAGILYDSTVYVFSNHLLIRRKK